MSTRITCPATLTPDDAEVIRAAVAEGECIVVPTDTVYGIGADAFSPEAVAKLLAAKGRGRDMPPPVLVAVPEVLEALASEVTAPVRAVIAAHWPGPLTIIVQRQGSLQLDLGETAGTIAVRVPDHAITRDILTATGPLAVSSANAHGQPPATDCAEAQNQLGETVAVYCDAGTTPGAEPSTIVDFTSHPGGRIVRRGVLSFETLRQTLPDLRDAD